jgi:hypothetical protein
MRIKLPKSVNETQEQFAELCAKGGGVKGGPARPKVQELLKESGKELNKRAEDDIAHALSLLGPSNPWMVCFAVGLNWGHLARMDDAYLEAAVDYLETGSSASLSEASKFYNERGPQPIEMSLRGGRILFERVRLPSTLCSTLSSMKQAQDRWLSPILSKDRPPYIGSWNATAMFMMALFAQPTLGDKLKEASVMLPPGGPIYAALSLLHQVGIGAKPEGSELDDQAFEPGAIFANTGLMAELLKGLDDWDLLDVHSGLYMLGTRDPRSASYFH